jgi:hypothetical protein
MTEINVGPDLIGYPFVHQSNNYNNKVSIPDEIPQSDYVSQETDDLSHVWSTNHRDNIDDLDVVLRDANINAHNASYYGASDLNSIGPADSWNEKIGKVLIKHHSRPMNSKAWEGMENTESTENTSDSHESTQVAVAVAEPVKSFDFFDNPIMKTALTLLMIFIAIISAGSVLIWVFNKTRCDSGQPAAQPASQSTAS